MSVLEYIMGGVVMETVALTFTYTQDEYVTAERQYLFASKTFTKTSVVALAVYLPASLFFLYFSSFGIWSILAVGVALFALIAGCGLYFYMPVYKFKTTSKYHEEYSLTFSNDAIQFATPTIHSELKWGVYSEIWESNDFYFLIQAPRMYTLIPKRVFSSPDAQQAFAEMASANRLLRKTI